MNDIDLEKLLEFEDGLDPSHPEKSRIVPTILGYGEISSTFSIDSMPEVAFKRMPPFGSAAEIDAYREAVAEYCRRLRQACGINVSEHAIFKVENRFGERIVYVAQPRLDSDTIGNAWICRADSAETEQIIETLCRCLIGVWQYNRDNAPHEEIGIDGQISNWSFSRPGADPVYFDITTPLFRINGKEQLDTEIFLKSCPSYLVWLVRWQFLQEVLDRYYDIRLVLIDLAANLYKEGCPEKIPAVLAIINACLEDTGTAGEMPYLTETEVEKYYKNDAFIWTLFLSLRRMDRFIKTRMMGRRYNFILPGRIKR